MCVCLNEESVLNFPSDRKKPLAKRLQRFKIEDKTLEEDRFRLLSGFQKETKRKNTGSDIESLIPAAEGAALLRRELLPVENMWKRKRVSILTDPTCAAMQVRLLSLYFHWRSLILDCPLPEFYR